jgi:hypothetical protein
VVVCPGEVLLPIPATDKTGSVNESLAWTETSQRARTLRANRGPKIMGIVILSWEQVFDTMRCVEYGPDHFGFSRIFLIMKY